MPLPGAFRTTRDALHALACYVISPARKARTGRIGLRAVDGGFGTPPFDDGSRIVVHGNRLARDPGTGIVITTPRAAGAFLGVELTPDPGVGTDLPPFEPDAALAVGVDASLFLGHWYGTGQSVIDRLPDRLGRDAARLSEAQLWPEHFDLAVDVELVGGRHVNVGFSSGDGFVDEPYVYVGPHDMRGLEGDYWNAGFGAYLRYSTIDENHQVESALAFIENGFALV
jgi:hypothetical protein